MLFNRRRFLKLAGGCLTSVVLPGAPRAAGNSYRAGVGRSVDPYEATKRAISASAEWPPFFAEEQIVVIKPNLVNDASAESGTTTDPEVVRAIVDCALESGAGTVLIVEGGAGVISFAACGYDFFENYDPYDRVKLVDLSDEPEVLVKTPAAGSAYNYIFLPACLTGENVFFVSAAKMKTHMLAMATLSMKNLFGLLQSARYHGPYETGLFGLHERGVHQATVDINLVRPVDFAVVDGIWAMEGYGPTNGFPVTMELVVAGRNAVAVDRVCLEAMGIDQRWVHHLALASKKGLGPATLQEIDIHGDSLQPHSFYLPDIPPVISEPVCYPSIFRPGIHNHLFIMYVLSNCPSLVKLSIVRLSSNSTDFQPVRALQIQQSMDCGFKFLRWDGRDDNGRVVTAPGYYGVQIQARHHEKDMLMYGFGMFYLG